jgi:methionine biosynthesis protein metW
MDKELFWDQISQTEETDLDDEKINRLLRFKAMQPYLENVKTILDIGGATGAFSLPLARMGFQVTHLDISSEMLKLAKEKAKDMTSITFIQGNAADLSYFEDNQFDLVICFDGAISFSGKLANKVISEACRVGKIVMMTVSNTNCMTATWLNYSLSKFNRLHPSVKQMMNTGYFNQADYDDVEEMTAISELKAYTPLELKGILEQNYMIVKECRSIGSLTHLYILHLYRQNNSEDISQKMNVLSDLEGFIDLCDDFDKNNMPDGMGSFRRAGLFAIAEKQSQKGIE